MIIALVELQCFEEFAGCVGLDEGEEPGVVGGEWVGGEEVGEDVVVGHAVGIDEEGVGLDAAAPQCAETVGG